MKKEIIVYARRSSDDDVHQVQSNESQLDEINERVLSRRNDLKVVGTPYEESHSAKAPGRPLFEEMMTELDQKKASGIVCWKLNRLARNAYDGGRIIWLFNQQPEFQIITPSKTYTKDDLLIMYFEFGVANQFINDLSTSVKRGLKTKATKGWLPSGAKAGYMNDKYADKGNKTIREDPKRFPLIKKAWQLMLEGHHSPPKILTILNKDWGYRTPKRRTIGGKPMQRSQIYRMFSDPFYYGEFEYPLGSGKWHHGKHKKMITKKEFDKVQCLLGKKGRPRPQKNHFNYTGLFRCGECNAMITAEDKRQVICSECRHKFSNKNTTICPKCNTSIDKMNHPTFLHYIYYRCTKRKVSNCSQKSIRVDQLEKQTDQVLSNIQISDRFKSWAVKYLNELNESEKQDRNSIVNSLQSTYKDCIKRIDNLVQLKISPQNTDNQLLTDSEFKAQKQILLKEKSELEERMKDAGNRITKWLELSEKTFDLACHAKYWFKEGDKKTKQEILQFLGSNLTIKDKIVRINLQKPFELIQQLITKEPTITPMFEPMKKTDESEDIEAIWSQNPTLLAYWDDFRTLQYNNQ
jgi:site-specific DNA recombinase